MDSGWTGERDSWLVKFARQKQKRIKGLAAHALHPINTG